MTRGGLVAAAVLALFAAAAAIAPEFMMDRDEIATKLRAPRPEGRGAGTSLVVSTRKEPASPSAVARIFGTAVRSAQVPAAPAETKKVPAPADWLRPIGAITDGGGITRLFIKDLRGNRILKVRSDGIAEDSARIAEQTDSAYIIELNGELYAIKKN